MIKWKCHNCGNIFESKTEEDFIEDAPIHCADCFNLNDFIERL